LCYNDSKSTVVRDFLNTDREVKVIRSAGKLFRKLTARSEKKLDITEKKICEEMHVK